MVVRFDNRRENSSARYCHWQYLASSSSSRRASEVVKPDNMPAGTLRMAVLAVSLTRLLVKRPLAVTVVEHR